MYKNILKIIIINLLNFNSQLLVQTFAHLAISLSISTPYSQALACALET